MNKPRVLAPLGLAVLSACGPTELFVSVSTDAWVGRELDRVEILAQNTASRQTVEVRPSASDFPLSLVVERSGDSDEVQVSVRGWTGAVLLLEQRAETRFRDGDIRALSMSLDRACIGVVCEANQSCRRGSCVSSTFETLPFDGPLAALDRPPPVGGPQVELGAGEAHTCATAGEVLRCWGQPADSRLGVTDPPLQERLTSLAIPGLRFVSGGQRHTCAVDEGGQLWLWGSTRRGEPKFTDSEPFVFPTSPALQCSAGVLHTCVLGQDGTVRCFGDNRSGQAGSPGNSVLDAEVLLPSPAVALRSRVDSSCALLRDGGIRCWGGLFSSTPTEIELPEPAVGLDVGVDAGCAVTVQERVACWGMNQTLTLTSTTEAVTVEGLANVLQVAVGDSFACALLKSGEVHCWGRGEEGQLGDGVAFEGYVRDQPQPVMALPRALVITVGLEHACARTENGRIACWGWGNARRLGNSENGPQAFPSFVDRFPGA